MEKTEINNEKNNTNSIKEEDSKEKEMLEEKSEEENNDEIQKNDNINKISKSNDDIKEEEKQEEELNKEESTNEYIIRCETCHLIPIIQIDKKSYKIHCLCENGHIKTDTNLSKALNDYKKFSIKTCSMCGERAEEDIYICLQCQKIFCLDGGCKKKHTKENPNHKLIDVNSLDVTCLEHLSNFSKYCRDCKKNICIKCQRALHGQHKLIDFGDILPVPDEIEKGKKIFETKKEKLLKIKESINAWYEEFNIKMKNLLESIEAQILINENILKNFKTELMNYQMIANFNYFSSLENTEIYSSNELMNFINEKSWLPRTFFITQILTKLEQPIQIKDEEEKINNNKNNLNFIKLNHEDTISSLRKSATLNKPDSKDKKDEKERISISSNQLKLNNIKRDSSSLFPKDSIKYGKDFYCGLNEIKNKNISKKTFKSNVSITDNIYSGLIDNKGIIFLGSDSCLNIYRFDLKANKIESEFSIKNLDGAVNTIVEIKDDFLAIGTSNSGVKIIEFLGNKKYRIHQEIINQDKDSIYKIIEISNYFLISCDERNIFMYKLKKNNYYEICQEINLNSPTCCILQISKNIIAANHIVLNKISFYELNKKQLNLKNQIDNIELSFSNSSMAILNDNFFCSIAKQNIYIISIEYFTIVKKVELTMNITNLFPLCIGMILLCHCKEKEKGKLDYSLSIKALDENNKDLLIDFDDVIIEKNVDDIDDIFYLNFFNPNYMVLVSQSNISVWG